MQTRPGYCLSWDVGAAVEAPGAGGVPEATGQDKVTVAMVATGGVGGFKKLLNVGILSSGVENADVAL